MSAFLLDTNVVLDLLLQRHPFAETAHKLLTQVTVTADLVYMAPHSLATCYYIAAKTLTEAAAIPLLKDLLEVVQICSFDHAQAVNAFGLSSGDYEDAMIMAAAHANGTEAIITRNGVDFKNSPVSVYSPEDYLEKSA